MINVKNIIQQGETAKYQVIIEHPGFSMTEDDFEIVLSWGMRGESLRILKSEMLQNEGGETFFTFPTKNMVGRVEATCRYWVPDTDMEDDAAEMTERSPLCWVITDAKLPTGTDPGLYKGEHVQYVRKSGVGLKTLFEYFILLGGQYLADVNGLPFLVRKKN